MNNTRPEKTHFIDEESLMLDSFRLGKQIYHSGFEPDFIVGLWRGGASVAMVVQECLQYFGVQADHYPIRTSYSGRQGYDSMVSNAENIGVHGIDYLVERLDSEHKVLLVDDVYSSGFSMEAVTNKLRRKTRQNMPEIIRKAAIWHRPVNERPTPDYYIHKTEQWLVLPYELNGLTEKEIRQDKPWVSEALDALELKPGS